MSFEYSELRGRIIARFGSLGNMARQMKMSDSSLSEKLSGKVPFSQQQIYFMSELLEIKQEEVAKYFFTPKVR